MIPKVSITKTPNTTRVLEDTNVNLTCTADGAPRPTINWSGNKGVISIMRSSTKTFDGKHPFESKSILLLKNVTNEQEGLYECTAFNKGRPMKKQVNLIVHGKRTLREQFLVGLFNVKNVLPNYHYDGNVYQ